MSRHCNLTPWARRALGADDAAGIEARAQALGARIVAGGGPGTYGPWTVHVSSIPGNGIRESVYHEPGLLVRVISGCLDRFRDQRDIVNEELVDLGFTPDELVTIANQSGVAVSRG